MSNDTLSIKNEVNNISDTITTFLVQHTPIRKLHLNFCDEKIEDEGCDTLFIKGSPEYTMFDSVSDFISCTSIKRIVCETIISGEGFCVRDGFPMLEETVSLPFPIKNLEAIEVCSNDDSLCFLTMNDVTKCADIIEAIENKPEEQRCLSNDNLKMCKKLIFDICSKAKGNSLFTINDMIRFAKVRGQDSMNVSGYDNLTIKDINNLFHTILFKKDIMDLFSENERDNNERKIASGTFIMEEDMLESLQVIHKIVMNSEVEGVKSIDDVLYYVYGDGSCVLLWYPPFKKDETFVIPEGVKRINMKAVFSNPYLKKVIIGKDVEEIVPRSFYDCKQLEYFEVKEGNNYFYSMEGVLYAKTFHWMDNYRWYPYNYYINESMATYFNQIPCDMFGDVLVCYPMNHIGTSFIIPNNVRSILHYAFEGTKLAKVELPKELQFVGLNAFKGCEQLEAVIISSKVIPIVEVTTDIETGQLVTPFDTFISFGFDIDDNVEEIQKYWINLGHKDKEYLTNYIYCGKK